MKTMSRLRRIFPVVFSLLLLLAPPGSRGAEDFLAGLGDHLKLQAFDGNVTAQVSGLVDAEGYFFRQPPPAFIDTSHDFLFNPRLTLFLDVQAGPMFYFFAQTRVDRGFDPADANVQIRLDEYALRFTPWNDGRVNIQAGKFATVVGQWTNRHDSWENPFINAPMPYEALTSIWDSAAADSAGTLLSWDDTDKSLRNPLIWGPAYGTGLAVSGKVEKFDYAVEVKNTPPSARPDSWNLTEVGFQHPTVAGRLGWRPTEAWNVGVSASAGTYLLPEAEYSLAPGRNFGDYRQVLLGQDISYAWHHVQIWAEFFENRFEIPGVGNADTFAYYIEAKYKFTPEFFGALRWNQQIYNDFPDASSGGTEPWSYNSWRIDAALTYRFTPDMQMKLQYSFLREERGETPNQNIFALQFTVKF